MVEELAELSGQIAVKVHDFVADKEAVVTYKR